MKKLQSLKEDLFQTLGVEKLKTIFGGSVTTNQSWCSCKDGGCEAGQTAKDDGLDTID